MYYVENSHPAIISAETFALTQDEMKMRKEDRARTTSASVFSGQCLLREMRLRVSTEGVAFER